MTGQSFLVLLLINLVSEYPVASAASYDSGGGGDNGSNNSNSGDDQVDQGSSRQGRDLWGEVADYGMAVFFPDGNHHHHVSKRGRRFCGQELVERIRSTCRLLRQRRQRNSSSATTTTASSNPRLKRDAEEDNLGLADLLLEKDGGVRQPPTRFKTVKALRVLRKRGAADDCCANSCSLSHLASFC